MKKIILFSFLVFAIASCTSDKYEVPQVTAEDCVADSTIDVINVTIADNFFSPASLQIAVGDTVNWSYTTGATFHTSTCDGTGGSTLPSGGTTWDSGVLSPGNSYKKAISVAGTYTYICIVHGISMSGTIVVKPRCQ